MPDPFEDFLQELLSAAELYRADVVRSRIAAVAATISYLRAMDVEPALYTPLLDVLGHLDDEREGRTGNLNPVVQNANMAVAAAVITLAMRAGNTREEAAKVVASQMGISTHDPKAVQRLQQFRKNLMDKRASAAARDIYSLVLVEATKAGVSPEDALRAGMEFLREKLTGTPRT
jgi:hypothetical protein